MSLTRHDTLRVPGARLVYEVGGSGPVLFMMLVGAEVEVVSRALLSALLIFIP